MKRVKAWDEESARNGGVWLDREAMEALCRLAWSAKELVEWVDAYVPKDLQSTSDENHCAHCALQEIESAVEFLDGGEFPWD